MKQSFFLLVWQIKKCAKCHMSLVVALRDSDHDVHSSGVPVWLLSLFLTHPVCMKLSSTGHNMPT